VSLAVYGRKKHGMLELCNISIGKENGSDEMSLESTEHKIKKQKRMSF
jgi:hypothetical protein